MSAIITKYWRTITFDFTGKSTYAGVFSIEVDENGALVQPYNFENISGDNVSNVSYNNGNLFFGGVGDGMLTNFKEAIENTVYTENEIAGTWSYVRSTTTVTVYTINSSASAGGTISPNGSVTIEEGNDQTFSFVASEGYAVSSVLVDGVDAGKLTTYTFTNVNADHTISASFEELATYDIEVTINMTGLEGEQEWNKKLADLAVSSEWFANHYVSQTFDQETGTATITITESDTFPNIFANWTAVISVVLPECFEVIEDGAFAGCTSLRTITFPSTVTNFGTLVFDGCTSLGKIIMNAQNPPTVDGDDLGVDNVEVDVPEGSGQAYANALGWSDQEIVDPTPEPVYGFNFDKMVDTDYLMQGIMKK